MKELGFEAAKNAISRSRSTEAIRASRETIENLDDAHRVPFEFPVASELLEAYLHRKSLPYTANRAARVYLSSAGKVSYDDLVVETGTDPTHIFGISKDNRDAETTGLVTPSFEEVVHDAETEQPSVTNIVEVDKTGLVVFKAYLAKTLSAMARDDMPRSAAEAADAKADDEVRQLRLLREILKDNPDVYSPKVIGRNKAVVALEYIQGEDVSHLVSEKRLDERMIGKISGVLSGLHASLEAKADYIKREFPIPEWHTANSVVCLEKKTAALSERDRNGDFDAGIFSRFTELVRKSQALIEEMGYRDFPDAIYGDFKGENMIAMPDGRVAVLDPVLCAGRRSMDIAKFGRSLYFNDPSVYAAHFAEFISAYEEKTHRTVNRSEVAHMLGFDMLNSMRGHLLLPQRAASVFPAPVTHVRDNIMFYLSAVEEALGGSTRLPSSP